jgi:hypothetical protein
MISDENLHCLITQIDKIRLLAMQHQLSEIALFKPRYGDSLSSLHFLVSRSEEKIIPFSELSEIALALSELLKIEVEEIAKIRVESKEFFKEEALPRIYSDILFLKDGTTDTEIFNFIKKALGFTNYIYIRASSRSEVEGSAVEEKASQLRNKEDLEAVIVAAEEKEEDTGGRLPKRHKKTHGILFYSADNIGNNTRKEDEIEIQNKEMDSHSQASSRLEKPLKRQKVVTFFDNNPIQGYIGKEKNKEKLPVNVLNPQKRKIK